MIKRDPKRCHAMVMARPGWYKYQCARRGVVEEDGQLWCKQHAPSAVKARADARTLKYEEKWDAMKKQAVARKEASRDAEQMNRLYQLAKKAKNGRLALNVDWTSGECVINGNYRGKDMREALDAFIKSRSED